MKICVKMRQRLPPPGRPQT